MISSGQDIDKNSERGSKKAFTFLIIEGQKHLAEFVLIFLPTLNVYMFHRNNSHFVTMR